MSILDIYIELLHSLIGFIIFDFFTLNGYNFDIFIKSESDLNPIAVTDTILHMNETLNKVFCHTCNSEIQL